MTAHPTLKHYINGRRETGVTLGRRENPSDLSDVVAEFARADAAQAERAIHAAADAREAWAQSAPQRRFEVLDTIGSELLARKDELARLVAREQGKPLREAQAEAAHAAQLFKFHAGEALRLPGEATASSEGVDLELTRAPVGVVAVIASWSLPLALPAAQIAPALAHGNVVVFKPAQLVPACAGAISDIISRAGLPAGAFNLVMGSGRRVGQTLVEHALVDAISFSGSAAVAQGLRKAAAARGAKLRLRTGGRNALIVLDDAELDAAVECAVESAFAGAGQRATAASRLIVTPRIFERFVGALRERTQALAVGPALERGTDMGPVVSREHLEHHLATLEAARAEGAEWLAGGARLQRETQGHYLSPALLLAHQQQRVAREPLFGPLACVLRADSYEHALALANDTPAGPCAGIITTSLKHATHFRRHARAPVALVNLPTSGAELSLQRRHATEFHTVEKTAYIHA